MVAPIPDRKKEEAIRLRVQARLSLDDIAERTGISKGALSSLLREIRLSEVEVNARRSEAASKSNKERKYLPDLSKFARWISGKKLPTDKKGQVAEAAVLLRLRLLDYEILMPPENSRMDFVVTRPGLDKFVRLQVKWARRVHWGRPAVKLTNGEGKKIRLVTRDTCDFVIGYDLETDTAYVMPIERCEGKIAKSCDEEFAEAWHLLGI